MARNYVCRTCYLPITVPITGTQWVHDERSTGLLTVADRIYLRDNPHTVETAVELEDS